MPATLSQIQACTTGHLIDAAAYWTQTADRWADVFLAIRNRSHSITWHGVGGDALRQRTGADLSVVSSKADQLRQAAAIARAGASEIDAAQRRVLHGVADAQDADFTVGEDLSVTDARRSSTPMERAARRAQAEAFAADIRLRAEQLDAADLKVAGQLAPTAAGVGNGSFPAGAIPAPDRPGNGIRLIDFEHAGGGQPSPHVPTTEENERGLAARVAEGAVIGGLSGLAEGGVGAVPGMIVGGGLGGIEWFIESTQK